MKKRTKHLVSERIAICFLYMFFSQNLFILKQCFKNSTEEQNKEELENKPAMVDILFVGKQIILVQVFGIFIL